MPSRPKAREPSPRCSRDPEDLRLRSVFCLQAKGNWTNKDTVGEVRKFAVCGTRGRYFHHPLRSLDEGRNILIHFCALSSWTQRNRTLRSRLTFGESASSCSPCSLGVSPFTACRQVNASMLIVIRHTMGRTYHQESGISPVYFGSVPGGRTMDKNELRRLMLVPLAYVSFP